MATGRGLHETVWDMRSAMDPGGLTWFRTRDVLGYLGQCGIHCGLTLGSNELGLAFQIDDPTEKVQFHYVLDEHPAVMVVKSETFVGAEHLVFWDGKHVRDPNLTHGDTTPISEYEILEIWPLVYLDEQRETWENPPT